MVLQKLRECTNCAECELKSPIFSHLSDDDLAILNQDRYVVSYQPEELIYKQGSSFTHVIIIVSGLVKCYIEGPSKDLILRLAKPVEMIIGPGLFIDNKHHNSTASLVPVEACFIPVQHFKETIRKNPVFAEDVIKDISSRSLFSFTRMMSLTQKQVPGRVAEALLYFSNNIYGARSFHLNLSRKEFADFCGATKESTIRVLKELKEEGLIKVDGNFFEIIDPVMIEKISNHG